MRLDHIHPGDALTTLRSLPGSSINCVVTSPPYWRLRDYGVAGQRGIETVHDCLGWASGQQCAECFICRMMEIFDEVRRVLREDGVCWVNLGDTYVHQRGSQPSPTGMNKNAKRPGGCPVPEGVKPKDLALIPQRFALAAQARGWWVRSDVIWRKTAPMPCGSSDRPRPTHEYIWLLTKNSHYAFDMDAVRLPLSPKTLTTHGTSHRPQGGGRPGQIASVGKQCSDAQAAHGRRRKPRWRSANDRLGHLSQGERSRTFRNISDPTGGADDQIGLPGWWCSSRSVHGVRGLWQWWQNASDGGLSGLN